MLNFFRKKQSEADRLLTKLQAIASGAEEAVLNKCAHCGTQLDSINVVDWIKVYCDPCKKLLRAEQISTAGVPHYDIDEILAKDSPFEIINSIAARTEVDSEGRPIPWASLLPPEAFSRAFASFDNEMRNGFASLLECCGGPETFIRGHHVLEALGESDALSITSTAKQIIESHGIDFPNPVPQDWWPQDDGISGELYETLDAELGELDSQYCNVSSEIYNRLLENLQKHVVTLRIRKPS